MWVKYYVAHQTDVCLLLKLEDITETRNGEDGANLVVDISDIYMSSTLLGILQDAKEDTQPSRGYILKIGAVDDDILVFNVIEYIHSLFSLWCGDGIETSLKNGNHIAVLFLDCCFHFDYRLLIVCIFVIYFLPKSEHVEFANTLVIHRVHHLAYDVNAQASDTAVLG